MQIHFLVIRGIRKVISTNH